MYLSEWKTDWQASKCQAPKNWGCTLASSNNSMHSSGSTPSVTVSHQFPSGKWDKAKLPAKLWTQPYSGTWEWMLRPPSQLSHRLVCVMWGGLLNISISSSSKWGMEVLIFWKYKNTLANPHKELKLRDPNCLGLSKHLLALSLMLFVTII